MLELLKNEPNPLVRRSMANNLNDLSRVHPELVVEVCRRWAHAGSNEARELVRHALRTLVKKGHRGALEVLGAEAHPRVVVRDVQFSAKSIRIGDELRFSFLLQSGARRTQDLVVDAVVYFVKAYGALRPKVFKLKRLRLEANGTVRLWGKVSFARMTTRRNYPGRHRIEVLINGVAHPLGEFDVRP